MLLVPCAAALLCAFGAQGAQGDRPAAQELWERGERRAALELWARELESSPSRELRLALAQHQLLVHAYQAALDSLSALPAGDADARQVRARALYALSRYAEAVPLLDGRDPQQCLLLVDALEALDREDEARAALTLAEEVLGAADPRVLTARGRERARRR